MGDDEFLNTEIINKLIHRSLDFRDKRSGEIPEYSPVQYVTPTWKYCSLKDENELNIISPNELEKLRKIKEKFFQEKNKNSEKLFSKLGEKFSTVVSFFSDEEIFDLYNNRNFSVEVNFLFIKENYLAEITREGIIIKNSHSGDTKKKIQKKNWLNTNVVLEKMGAQEKNFEGKEIQITLPPIFKYIDYYKKFEEKTLEIQKIDQKGRVFYVNDKLKTSSFKHPLIPKRIDKKVVLKDEETINKEIKLKNEGWDTIYYKHKETGEVYLLYVNSLRKDTSWNPFKVSIIKK
jgi:hypothetical protein